MAEKAKLPKWATPERRDKLVELFYRGNGFCVFGHKPCSIPEHHFEIFIDDLIKDWILADREQRQAEYNAELKIIHSLGEQRYPLRGQFSAVSKDIWAGQQPVFYIQGLGIDGIKLKPFVKVRLASSYMRLYIDLGDSLKGVSKSKRRKALRYGKPLPQSTENTILQIASKAVRDYINH